MMNLFLVNYGERFVQGLQVAAIGIAFVFVVLILLVGAIYLFSYIVKLLEGIHKKGVAAYAPSETPIAVESNVDEEVACAITAAIYSFYQAKETCSVQETKAPFVIRNIKRIK